LPPAASLFIARTQATADPDGASPRTMVCAYATETHSAVTTTETAAFLAV